MLWHQSYRSVTKREGQGKTANPYGLTFGHTSSLPQGFYDPAKQQFPASSEIKLILFVCAIKRIPSPV